MKRLENKVAVVYGDGEAGGAIAKDFAREGAMVFFDKTWPPAEMMVNKKKHN
ncbi:MAG TPA: hypothetical protein VIH22_16815 [Cyclobacteriaceae bacterium]